MRNVTIQDVADQAGVSKTTVSRYLNGHFNKMSSETRDRIAKIIRDLDYRPNRQAQGLKSNKSYYMGVIIADIEDYYSSSLLKAIQEVVDGTDYQLLVVHSNNSVDSEQKAIERLLNHNIDGLMLQPVANRAETFELLAESGVPTVLIDRKLEQNIWPVVHSDNRESILKFGQILKDKAYQRIIHVSQPLKGVSPRFERYEAIQEIGQEYDMEVELVEIHEEDTVRSFLQADKNELKTVIFASNGIVLYDILVAVTNLKILIPYQYGLFGYDDGKWGKVIPPGISGIYQDISLVGKKVAELMLRQIDGIEVTDEIIVGTSIVERNSL